MMKRNMKAMLIGAAVGAILTLVVLAPFWIAPGSALWSRIGNLPHPVSCAIDACMQPFGFAGVRIADAIHHHRCEPLGCRKLHWDWMVGWSIVVNTTVGGLVGLLGSAARKRLGRTTHWWVFSLRSKPTV